MKIRDGFVSNSSSSSFLIGLKKISENEIEKYVELAEKVDCCWGIIKSILDDNGKPSYEEIKVGCLSLTNRNGFFAISTFNGSEVSLKLEPGEFCFAFSYIGDEGDSAFYNCDNRRGEDEEDEDYLEDFNDVDYDINLDFFPIDVIDIACKMDNLTFGADRNG